MTRSTNTSIHFDKQEFLKTSKKLTKEIQEYLGSQSIDPKDSLFPLSAVQDLQAKSLGFRNTDAILKFFGKPRIDKDSVVKRDNFLNNLSKDDMISLFDLMLANNGKNDLWAKRAMTLISTVIQVVDHLREKQKITINVNLIQKYLNLTDLFEIYKEPETLPEEIKEFVLSYLTSLPGFYANAIKQNETTMEQHSYLQMQFSQIIIILKQVEKNDVLIISPKWYRGVYCSTKQAIGDCSFIYTNLNENNLQEIYDSFPIENWVENFRNGSNNLKKIIKEGKIDRPYFFTGFELNSVLKHHPKVDNSWLKDETFKVIIKGMIEYKQFKNYYLSDLLINSFSIINEQKRTLYSNFVFNLLNSYNTVVSMSKEFDELSK